jgi:16S rRNA pseudouridine516 synthase
VDGREGVKERLDKRLANAGVGSRTEVAALVRRGRVTVDGAVIRDPSAKIGSDAVVAVDGAPLVAIPAVVMLHKPAGYVTSTVDRDGPPVTRLLEPTLSAHDWMPVGRLDADVEGLLLLTTDGELAHRLTHPRWKVAKRYEAWLDAPVAEADAVAFRDGSLSLDGEPLLPAELTWADDPAHVELVIREGRYHQVKRMFAIRGNRVARLRRIAFGPLSLPDDLPIGTARPLGSEEEAALRAAVGL